MAKKSKTESTNGSTASDVPAPVISEPKKPAAKKSAKKAAVKKGSAKKATTQSKAKGAKKRIEPTDEQIRLRAYFIAERRSHHSLEGDPANDWLQARQELLAELNRGDAGKA